MTKDHQIQLNIFGDLIEADNCIIVQHLFDLNRVMMGARTWMYAGSITFVNTNITSCTVVTDTHIKYTDTHTNTHVPRLHV